MEASRKTDINEACVKKLQSIYSQATAWIHLDKLVSYEFPKNRGVRQGDTLSRKLLPAIMEEVFEKADISKGISVDGENVTNLRFADDVAFFNKKNKTN